jgi:hypothetical protein
VQSENHAEASPQPFSPPSATSRPSIPSINPADKTPEIQVAPNLAALREALRPIGCTFTTLTAGDAGPVVIEGLSGAGKPEAALRDAIGTAVVDWRVHRVDGPYCAALDMLRDLAARNPRSIGTLSLALRGNVTQLAKGSNVVVRAVMPDFPTLLQVDYLASDGLVTHLVHDDGTTMRVTSGDSGAAAWKRLGSSRRYTAGATVTVGEKNPPDPREALGDWVVDEPYGQDMVLVFATSSPLFKKPRPPDERQDSYLRDLQTALTTAQADGVRLAGQAILLDTTDH